LKVYVAAPFSDKKVVLDTYKKLRTAKHEIIADWTVHKDIKPYSQNLDTAKDYAIEDIDGVRNSEVFILILGTQPGTGSSTELGAAIMSFLCFAKPKIYVVGKYIDQNFCFFHPSVELRDSIDEVIEEINN